jgi:hypothetical protein
MRKAVLPAQKRHMQRGSRGKNKRAA